MLTSSFVFANGTQETMFALRGQTAKLLTNLRFSCKLQVDGIVYCYCTAVVADGLLDF